MESENSMNKVEQKRLLDKVRSDSNYSPAQVQLVASDIEYGLSIEQIDRYLNKSFEYRRMKAVSDCLRNGYPDVLIDLAKELDTSRFEMAVEYYAKGVRMEDLVKTIEESQNAMSMKKMLQMVYEKLESTPVESGDNHEHIEKLVETVKTVTEKLDEQTTVIAGYQKQLESERSKEKEEIKELYKNLTNKDDVIRKQAEHIRENEKTIYQLTDEVEKLQAGTGDLKNKISEVQNSAPVIKKGRQEKAYIRTEERKADMDNYMSQNNRQYSTGQERSIPVSSFQTEINGEILEVINNNVSNGVRLERSIRKSNPVKEFFSRVFAKKKPVSDLLRLVIERKLSKEQLSQIKIALLKGLDEDQMMLIINPEMSAEEMAGTIEIAAAINEKGWGRKKEEQYD